MSATTVTHADREAAWPYAGFHCLPDRQMRERWFSGYYDNLEQGKAIRAFARHRQSADRGELVAWMYERKGFAPAVSMRDPRLRYSDIEALHPLYTLPPAPEAGQ